MNYQPRGISDQAIQGPASYASELSAAKALLETQQTWNGISAESVARMRLQNRFQTGLDIARYTAAHHARATWPPMTPIPPSTPSRSAAGTASSASRS